MHHRQLSSLSILLTLALLAAAGCGDDTVSSCNSGECGGDSGEGGDASGGSTSSKGGTTSGGQPGSGGAMAGTSNSAGQGGGSAGSSTAAGASNSAGTAGIFGLAGATTAGAGNVAGTAGSSQLSTGGTSAGGSGNGGIGGNAGNAGSTAVAGAGGTTPIAAAAILKYDFEDGTGTKVTDSSSNGNDGELAGAAWTGELEGRNARGVSFTDADPAIALPDSLFTSAAGLTVSAWVKLTSNSPGNCLFDLGSAPDNHIFLTLNNDTGSASGMELGVQLNGGDLQKVFTTALLPVNVWKHVAVSIGTSGTRLYVDGWEVARNTTLAVAPSALGATPNNWIGRAQVPIAPFAGTIDEFYVYDNALPLAEIRKLAWPKTDYSIWHFDESEGTVAADSSDLKRDGTMVRATFGSGVVGNSAQLYNPSDTDTPPAGADQYVQLPEGIVKDCTTGYTVAAWLNVIAVRTHARVFEFSNDTTAAVFGRTMGGWTQHWALGDFTDPTTTSPYASIDYTWPVGTWHHVAAVREGQILHAYLDGAETGTKTPFTLPSTVPPVSSLGNTLYNYIGRTRDSAASNERRRLHGFVDEFLLSCRPYTAAEIKLLATRPQ